MIPRLIGTGVSSIGAVAGQLAQNALDSCSSGNLGNAALFGGLGGAVASLFPNQGLRTLAQARYFGPRRIGSMYVVRVVV